MSEGSRWPRRVLVGLLAIHVAWGVARIPGKVYRKRFEKIAEHEKRGAARFHLDNRHRQGAEVVEFLVENTPEDCVVLWRGDYRGALEFVPPLIAPRLLVSASHCPEGTDELFGRPVATATNAAGQAGTVVVVGKRDSLEWELR